MEPAESLRTYILYPSYATTEQNHNNIRLFEKSPCYRELWPLNLT